MTDNSMRETEGRALDTLRDMSQLLADRQELMGEIGGGEEEQKSQETTEPLNVVPEGEDEQKEAPRQQEPPPEQPNVAVVPPVQQAPPVTRNTMKQAWKHLLEQVLQVDATDSVWVAVQSSGNRQCPRLPRHERKQFCWSRMGSWRSLW